MGQNTQDSARIVVARPELLFEVSDSPYCNLDNDAATWKAIKFRHVCVCICVCVCSYVCMYMHVYMHVYACMCYHV